jgi:hypothetical protein
LIRASALARSERAAATTSPVSHPIDLDHLQRFVTEFHKKTARLAPNANETALENLHWSDKMTLLL